MRVEINQVNLVSMSIEATVEYCAYLLVKLGDYESEEDAIADMLARRSVVQRDSLGTSYRWIDYYPDHRDEPQDQPPV